MTESYSNKIIPSTTIPNPLIIPTLKDNLGPADPRKGTMLLEGATTFVLAVDTALAVVAIALVLPDVIAAADTYTAGSGSAELLAVQDASIGMNGKVPSA
ncbi:hypothetical protein OEA41_009161 [Lepraria neglecta]|uniref:Uncharacterized protein n=1 Tax=Lepraria neglecta TaxID=209136 RepID=A0AAD9Z4C7_9LECA|nr:hypothetical protein OEA41_009161 [Lepraria neglecta]